MASLVLDLQAIASDSGQSVPDVLRRAKVVSSKLGLTQVTQWIDHELNGYEDAPVPDYRRVSGVTKVRNPYRGLQPFMIDDEKLQNAITMCHVAQSVASLGQLLSLPEDGHLQFPFSPGQLSAIQTMMRNSGFPEFEVIRLVDRSAIAGMLDSVRNRVLDWALRLEQDGILGESMSFSAADKFKAESTQPIYIQHFTGVLGNVSNSTVDVRDAKRIGDLIQASNLDADAIEEILGLVRDYEQARAADRPTVAARARDWISEHAIDLGALVVSLAQFFGLGKGG